MEFLLHVQQIINCEYENYSIEFGTDQASWAVAMISAAIKLYRTGDRKKATWIGIALYRSVTGENFPSYPNN